MFALWLNQQAPQWVMDTWDLDMTQSQNPHTQPTNKTDISRGNQCKRSYLNRIGRCHRSCWYPIPWRRWSARTPWHKPAPHKWKNKLLSVCVRWPALKWANSKGPKPVKKCTTACVPHVTPQVAGAPKMGDAGAWGARIAQGRSHIVQNTPSKALPGKPVMPPKAVIPP